MRRPRPWLQIERFSKDYTRKGSHGPDQIAARSDTSHRLHLGDQANPKNATLAKIALSIETRRLRECGFTELGWHLLSSNLYQNLRLRIREADGHGHINRPDPMARFIDNAEAEAILTRHQRESLLECDPVVKDKVVALRVEIDV